MTRILIAVWSVVITFALVVIALPFLLVAELVARCTYRRPWYLPVASWKKPFLRWQRRRQAKKRTPTRDYPTNQRGFRDRDFQPLSAERKARTIRILALGDSYTEGWGVARPEDTFCKIVERRLCERGAQGDIRYEVMNAGWGASFTTHWVDAYRTLRDEFQPDLVLAVFFTRDGTLLGHQDFFDAIRENLFAEAGLLYRLSCLVRPARDAELVQRLSTRLTAAFVESYFGRQQETVEWHAAQNNLLLLRDLIAASSSKFMLINFPTLYRLDHRHPFRRIYAAIEAFAVHHHIPYLDLFPVFAGHESRELWAAKDDQHPNERGHEMVGGYLADILWEATTELRWLKAGSTTTAEQSAVAS